MLFYSTAKLNCRASRVDVSMGLSEDLTQLVTEAKNSRKLIRPYAAELVRRLIREMNVLYRSIETGFMPNVTQSLTQLSSVHAGLSQEPNSQTSTPFVSSEATSSKRLTQPSAETQTLAYTPESIHMQQLVYFLGIHRIKRALLIYHTLRLQTIQQQIWLTGHLPLESAYTGLTPQRTREAAKTYSFKADVVNSPLGKRQLGTSSSASTPKRRRFLSHDGDEASQSNLSQLTSSGSSSSPFRTPRRASHRINGGEVSSNLSSAEINFGTAYQLLIGSLSAQFPLVDLLGSLEPPKEVYLEVRVIRDCGEILTNGGPITLEAGSQLFVRKADVEQLLINGDIKAI